jgi:hypothetical protein
MTPGGSPVLQVGMFAIFPQHVPGPDPRLQRLSFPEGRATDLGLQCLSGSLGLQCLSGSLVRFALSGSL